MKKSLLLGVLLTTVLLSACGSGAADKNSYALDTGALYTEEAYPQEAMDYDTADVYENSTVTVENGAIDAQESATVTDDRKLITTMNMSVETDQMDALMNNVEEKTESLNGYIESSSMYSDSDGLRCCYYTIRIPQEQLDSFVATISGESNVISKSTDVSDVTLSYVDMESRKEVLEEEEDRLQQMLQESTDIETMLAVEARLSEVICQKESMEAQLRTYDNQINYSTIYLNIEEVAVYTVVYEQSDWEKMSQGFMNSVKSVMSGLKNFGIGIVIAFPYIFFISVIVLVFFLIIRAIIKHNNKQAKKTKLQQPIPIQQPMPMMQPMPIQQSMQAQQPVNSAQIGNEEATQTPVTTKEQ